MKTFQKLTLVFALTFLIVACTQVQNEPNTEDNTVDEEKNMDEYADHVGCQEGEINKDGECVPAEEKNTDIFSVDVSETVVSEEISMENFQGYLAKPAEEGDYPGVLMIHEWWGLNDNIKTMADILAHEGYVVFAIDLYDGQVAEDSDAAQELATAVRTNSEGAVAKMKSALNYLREEQNATQVGSLGWCFGGQQSLNIAINDTLDATVIYYGQLTDNKEELQNITWPVMGVFGSEDESIPVTDVVAFEEALNEVGVMNNIHIFSGVGHAFANPSGSNYAPEETMNAWEKTLIFLEDTLKD